MTRISGEGLTGGSKLLGRLTLLTSVPCCWLIVAVPLQENSLTFAVCGIRCSLIAIVFCRCSLIVTVFCRRCLLIVNCMFQEMFIASLMQKVSIDRSYMMHWVLTDCCCVVMLQVLFTDQFRHRCCRCLPIVAVCCKRCSLLVAMCCRRCSSPCCSWW